MPTTQNSPLFHQRLSLASISPKTSNRVRPTLVSYFKIKATSTVSQKKTGPPRFL